MENSVNEMFCVSVSSGEDKVGRTLRERQRARESWERSKLCVCVCVHAGPFLGIGELGGRLGCHQLWGANNFPQILQLERIVTA